MGKKASCRRRGGVLEVAWAVQGVPLGLILGGLGYPWASCGCLRWCMCLVYAYILHLEQLAASREPQDALGIYFPAIWPPTAQCACWSTTALEWCKKEIPRHQSTWHKSLLLSELGSQYKGRPYNIEINKSWLFFQLICDALSKASQFSIL